MTATPPHNQLTLCPALCPAQPGSQGERHFRLIRQGLCPVCEAPMSPVQVGRDVHAHPCTH